MLFDGWSDLGRVALIGVLAYAILVLAIRLSGKRTLASLNAFDFVVTVALGSTLATILLSADVSLSEGAIAVAVLVVAQLVVALASNRWSFVRRAVKSTPVVVMRNGQMIREALHSERVSEAEVRQVVRSSGAGDLSGVGAVVLETDGSLSVIALDRLGSASALADVADRSAATRRSR